MRRILIFSATAILAVLIVLAVIAQTKSKVVDDITNTTATNKIIQPDNNTKTDIAPPAQEDARTEVITASRMFAERYASFSSLTPAASLAAALPFASASLRSAFERTIASAPRGREDMTTTSRAFAFNVQSLDEQSGRAAVVVSLQRSEQKGTDAPRKYNQDLALQLLKEGAAWKVNVAIFSTK